MEEKWRLFRLLLWKNYLIRKRHWKVPLFLQILLPVCTFLIMQKIRSLSFDRKNPENVKYYPIDTLTKESLESHNILLHYAPENNFTTALVKKTTQCLSIHPANVTGFPSEEEMLKNHYFDDRVGVYYAILAIIFKDDESSSRKYLDYTVRSSQDTPISLFGGGLQDYYHSFYARYCFLNAVPYVQTQMCIDEAFINISAPNPSISHKVFIQRMPTSRNGGRLHFDEGSRLIFSITAVGVFFVTLCLEASFSASEKYIGVNILMAQNGIKFHMNLCSWLVSGILYSLFYTTVITISITEAFDNPFLFHGNSFIIWLFLIFHTAHLIAFGMHIASYFSNFLTMMIIILILYGGASLFQGYLIDSFIYSIIPYLGIIFPNILLFRMFQEMNLYETLATGVQWSNMFRNADSSYSAAGSIGVMMLFSIIGTALHFFLCVHIYTIFPGKFGIQKHPFYFLQKKAKFYEELDKELEEFNYDNADGTPFEKTPSGIFAPTIQIRNIKKSYKKDLWNKNTQEALNGISIDIHKGQITTVLGHNGSGKTAMMSILAGLSSPTEGVVLIDGKSISDFYTTFSTDLSFCPQENMFFPYLTVIEQMEFFGTIKCLNKSVSQLKMLSFHVEKLLRKLKIYDKRNYFPEELPKNQQRRLCLGLNLITSNAKILLFDEPTSGMDAESKRDTWNMLLEMKCEKTILISTQDTEEADILSDKIAILHLGKLKSYGTPIFLKKLYGQGNIEITFSITSWCDTEIVRKELSEETELLRLEDETMVICVPYTDQLAESLDEIESKKRDLGVTAINVSLVTLEQVFLKVTKKEEDVDFSRPFVNLAYCSKDYELLLQTIYALFEKNFIRTRRSLSILLPIMLLPLISILLMTLNYSSLSETHESRSLNLGLYNNPQVMLSTTNETLRNKLKNFVDNSSGTTINIDPNLNLQNEILQFSEKDIAAFRNHLITAIEFNATAKSINANALYSETALFSIPIGVNIISNVMIKTLAGDDYNIHISDHPLPTLRDISELNSGVLTLLLICFLYPAVSLYVLHPAKELSSGVKHLQIMSGVSPITYWSTQFVFDLFVFFISVMLCLIGFRLMDLVIGLQCFQATELAVMALLLMLFAVNVLPLLYIFSFVKMSKTALVTLLSFLPMICIFVEIVNPGKVFQLIPYNSFFNAHISFLNVGIKNAHCRYLARHQSVQLIEIFCEEMDCVNGTCHKHIPYFGKYALFSYSRVTMDESVAYLSLTPFIYFAILALIELNLWQKVLTRFFNKNPIASNEEVDDQVREEKYSVEFEVNKLKSEKASKKDNKLLSDAIHEGENTFLLHELSKYYKSKPIVSDVSFSVKSGECFGLLGVNGAGKSTIFRILTGEELPNKGDMFLGEKDIFTEKREYLSKMGYCPQNTALIDSLNVRDHLRLFAFIRGVPKHQVDSKVEEWINRLNLSECASRPSATYSVGNKRCLSIAMAFIGQPDLVLLDEPTTGVDPASRKSLWNMIKSFLRSGQSVILTSQSMEECEALCNRLAIMSKGRLVCIGPTQKLKERFGHGYNIHIELNLERTQAETEAIKTDIENALNCELGDEHVGYMTFFVTNSETPWKTMYELMNGLKYKYPCIVDFTILSATLEQVFLRFAKADIH
ncbi:phospholipid-transporting ATPase ABCA1-like isoform X2 [Belonocnema kinseyi]|uniref:phospholipid-transporting ATPase ABCA1-like isoform X2 n=1 Tax=Belonocnema kinseyi TaxID=2817044 RepID=UPI00143DAAA0|nr:phospholipid-transporting ATPase ABCA1-like isoform X2 [Belonocnema kinseyi]